MKDEIIMPSIVLIEKSTNFLFPFLVFYIIDIIRNQFAIMGLPQNDVSSLFDGRLNIHDT